MQTQSNQSTNKEVVFDENGQTMSAVEAAQEIAEPDTVADEAKAAALSDMTAPAEEAPAEPKKFRIGDREFATQEEALSYATNLQAEVSVTDAYRQGIRDALQTQGVQQPNVTPPKPAFNAEELYTNPQEFLQKYANQIKGEARSEFDAVQASKEQSEQIWREFCNRHPELSHCRQEVEGFVTVNLPDVQGVIRTKGRDASYDFIATKLKSRFEQYVEVVRPGRALPNTKKSATPVQRGSGVTPNEPEKKPLSFSEQIRSIRKRR